MKKKEGKIIQQAAEEQHFIAADGRRLGNVVDLANALDDMNDDVFNHHVTEDKNDFSNWVKNTLNEDELADDIAKKKNRMETQLAIMKQIMNRFMDQ